MDTERVEFVDAPVAGPGGDDLVESGDHGRPPRRWGLLVVGSLVVIVLAALAAGQLVGGGRRVGSTVTGSPTPPAIGRPSAATLPAVYGIVGLPDAISEPRTLVAAQSGDVVWMLDRGAGIVRIENGHRSATTLMESQVTAIAVSPAGDRLYVATGASRPAIQVLDATTLAPGPAVPIHGSIQAIAVSTDAVWAASGEDLFRLDLDSLQTLGTVVMPGVVLTAHLRIQSDQSEGDQQYVVGLVTSPNDDGTTTSRFVRVDPLTQERLFGPPIPHVTDVATSHYLTWATTSASPPATEGFLSVLDTGPTAATSEPLAPGTHIYDGGAGFAAFLSVAPHSSVISCHDDGGFARTEIDVAPAVPDAVITGQVLRTDTAFYAITDRGLVRSGVGTCT